MGTLMRDSLGSEEATTAVVEGKKDRQMTKILNCLVLEEEIVDLVEAAEEEITLEVVKVDSIAASTTADLDVDAHLSHFTTMGKFKETVEAEMRPDEDGVIQQAGTVDVAISIAAQDTQITLGPTMLVLTTMESKIKTKTRRGW